MFSKKNKSKFSNFNNSDRLLFNKKIEITRKKGGRMYV